MKTLPRAFYDRDTLEVARALLGKHLVRRVDGAELVVRITETEAYIGAVDKACHAYGGRRTARTETLYAQPGTAYVYLIYGMYHCLNFVTEPEGTAAAVLLRGVEAVSGTDLMAYNRFGREYDQLTAYQRKNFLNGPGKVCKALAITRAHNGLDLTGGGELFLCDGEATAGEIHVGKRVGIDYAEEAVDFPWRFWL
ncbi:DNA-3-methyladenine glycosylase [uncultured Intestinimonas sp.]|uniref:DNA-3-methyladenine glycosylase n=1 Tax=uncultured Intestinimonas sp. TaxID=1689265 RepID=UPI0025FA9F56|nr:DNA-3-methyladenine glycosylase [uncultured Intestinimonas sp.]